MRFQAKRAKFCDRHIGQEEIKGLAFGMLTIARNFTPPAAQHVVGAWRAVAGNHMNWLFGTGLLINFPNEVKQCRVHPRWFIAAEVAQKAIKLLQTAGNELAVLLVGDRQALFGMRVIQRERSLLRVGARGNKKTNNESEEDNKTVVESVWCRCSEKR